MVTMTMSPGYKEFAVVTWLLSVVAFNCTEGALPELSNLALNKPASQSSTAANGVASLAVDGNHNSNYYYENGSCTHTACGSGPGLWWMVDLERTAIVYEIKITNRNKFGERLADLNVLIGKSLDSLKLCAYFQGPGISGVVHTIHCTRPQTGRYVKLQKIEDDQCLTLCEVEVMGQHVPYLQAIFNVVPGMVGSSNNSVSFNVPTGLSCPMFCLRDATCVGYNMVTNAVCELLKNSMEQNTNNNSSVLLYN